MSESDGSDDGGLTFPSGWRFPAPRLASSDSADGDIVSEAGSTPEDLDRHDRIESALGPGWSALVPHLRGSQAGGPPLLPDDFLADDLATLDHLRSENEDLRAVLAALVFDHGSDGRLVVSDRAMLHVVRTQAQADVVVEDHPRRWTNEERP